MSNSEQAISAVAGGIIGFFVTGGNPAGALKGACMGIASGADLAPLEEAPSEPDATATVPVHAE